MVEVVSGILVKEGRILLVQRKADKDFPLTWECPGGKVEGREHHHDALRREFREELGIDVGLRSHTPWWVGEFKNEVTRPDREHIQLFLYRVHLVSGTPTPREGQGLGWFSSNEMSRLSAAPGLEAVRDRLVHAMGLFEPPAGGHVVLGGS